MTKVHIDAYTPRQYRDEVLRAGAGAQTGCGNRGGQCHGSPYLYVAEPPKGEPGLQNVADWFTPPPLKASGAVIGGAFGVLKNFGDDAAGAVAKGVPVETFEGTIRRRVLQSDVEAFRFSGGISDPKGRFLTTRQTLRQINSPQDAQRVLQLPEDATAETLNQFMIPKGTEIFVGRVKGGPPGATQVFIRDPSVLR